MWAWRSRHWLRPLVGMPFFEREVPWRVPLAGLALGVITIWYLVASGNSQGMVRLARLAPVVGTAGFFGVLTLIKPLVAAGPVTAGAEGCLITPSGATGAAAAAADLIASGHSGLLAAGALAAVTRCARDDPDHPHLRGGDGPGTDPSRCVRCASGAGHRGDQLGARSTVTTQFEALTTAGTRLASSWLRSPSPRWRAAVGHCTTSAVSSA